MATMLTWAVDHRLIRSNPISKLQPLPREAKEGRPLTTKEVSRLLESVSVQDSSIWYAYLVSGMRCDELANLVFSDND